VKEEAHAYSNNTTFHFTPLVKGPVQLLIQKSMACPLRLLGLLLLLTTAAWSAGAVQGQQVGSQVADGVAAAGLLQLRAVADVDHAAVVRIQRRSRALMLLDDSPQPSAAGAAAAQRCSLPRDPGPCRAQLERFHFSPSTQSCQPFAFGGCQGNGNNFQSRQVRHSHGRWPLRRSRTGLSCWLGDGRADQLAAAAARRSAAQPAAAAGCGLQNLRLQTGRRPLGL
jgi:hypothetical protein